MTNRLAHATSPYLLQHAENPVDWREWGDDAFAEAVRRDVPVLLSVGYAACHWCHVMAHESFEDDETAREMNENFVCIKVDREERPDIDAVYMNALQLMTHQGGWPMTVFLTPDTRAPYYAGTYYPSSPRYGSPSFRQVLDACRQAWDERRDALEESAARIVDHLAASAPESAGAPPGDGLLAGTIAKLAADFDAGEGGFGGAPKFPPAMTIVQLLRHTARVPDADESGEAHAIASATCRAMARGGMYDQVGGGFARYSTDATWTVPHFEKMLYDNALLLRAYTEWWLATGDPLAERVARETARWMLAELRTDEGAFASSLDADTDGIEGAYYVWSPADLNATLGEADGAWAADLFGVTESGTFDAGKSVLQLRADPDDNERWDRVRRELGAARAHRTRPGRDDKIVAGWNGLAISALARAGKVFAEPEFLVAASATADFLRRVHTTNDRLVRTSRRGEPGTSAGVLDDYGLTATGYLDLYQATGDAARLRDAEALLDAALAHFTDSPDVPTEFFDTADDAEQLIVRGADPTDNASPSGRSALAEALVAYAALTGSARHRTAAENALTMYSSLALGYPRFAGWGLAAAEALADGPRQVAVVEAAGSDHTLADDAWRTPAAGAVIAVLPARSADSADNASALFEGRTAIDGRDTAYVCRGFVCDLPTADPAELRRQLG